MEFQQPLSGEAALAGSGSGNENGDRPDPLAHARRNHTNPVVSSKESAAINASTGSLSVSVPVYTSPGRSGFGPSLSLTYDSSRENGTFGLGWGLNTECIMRKSSKKLPRYQDDGEDADVFLLSGVEDLVPTPVDSEVLQDGWKIRRYLPRIISQAMRIERRAAISSSEDDIYWRVISADNVTTIFGGTDESRVFEPASQRNGNRKRIFSWLISDRFDAHGNAIHFRYKAEDGAGVDTDKHIYEENRGSPYTQRYLKSITYGNRVPNRRLDNWVVDPTLVPKDGWMFEVVLDYGDHDTAAPTTKETAQWPVRRDPFSVHSSGFEIRSYRLCQRILMFHHIPEEFNGVRDILVSSTTCCYDGSALPNGIPLLTSMTTCGHAPGLEMESLAPSSFEYTVTQPAQSPILMDADSPSLRHAAAGLAAGNTEWLDFDGEGLSGWLTRQEDAWYYQRNESSADSEQKCCFSIPKLIPQIPSASKRASFFTDLSLRGKPGFFCGARSDENRDGETAGYYDRTENGGWSPFVPFSSSPNINLEDMGLRMVDLTGDGRPDLLRLTSDTRTGEWFPSLAAKGFGELSAITVPGTNRPGLRIGDTQSYIYMADMTGDGLADIVQIRNGSITYWPNQGYGTFGASVAMGNAPHIEGFTHERLRLANITGSGMTDLIYLPPGGGVWIFYNRVGNQWSDVHILPLFPELDNMASVMVIDLFGRGTACLCWVSSSATSPTGGAKGVLQYIDLVGGQKPGLLKVHRNGSGLERLVDYSPSTKFYLQDERSGHAWKTPLPFPVHCAESITTIDHITGSTATTRYAYHDGYYDMLERELRGFGMVEQWHTETFRATTGLNEKGSFSKPTAYHKSWYHLGRLPAVDHLPADRLLQDSDVDHFTADACRALKGLSIRDEVYSDHDSAPGPICQLVKENRYEVITYQGPGTLGQGVYRVIPREDIKSYSDKSDDPRLLHNIVLEVNDFGFTTKAASIAYGKTKSTLADATDRRKQEETVILYTEACYTNAVDSDESFRLPELCETTKYRVSPSTHSGLFDYVELIKDDFSFFRCLNEVDVEDAEDAGIMKEGVKALIARDRVLYRSSDLSRRLPTGQLEIYSDIDQTFQLTITRRNLSGPLSGLILDPDYKGFLEKQGGYVDLDRDNHWWTPTGRARYAATSDPAVELKAARAGFYIPTLRINPFGSETRSELDEYKLFPVQRVDGVQNTFSSVYDYAALQPKLSTDPNGNQTTTVYDALRRVVGGAVSGKVAQGVGDSLDGFRAQLTADELNQFIKNPEDPVTRSILKQAGHRIIYRAAECVDGSWVPAFQAVISRDEHASDSAQLGIEIIYLDGSRNTIQATSLESHQRWRCSGRTIYNSQSLLVRRFLAFFSKSHTYQPQSPLDLGPSLSTTVFRDALGQVLGTLQADHTWSKVRRMPWLTEHFDAGDTVLTSNPVADPDVGAFFNALDQDSYMPSWYDRAIQSTEKRESDAARKSAAYNETPDVAHSDSLGRTIVAIQDNGIRGKYATRTEFGLLGHVSRVTNARGNLVTKACYDMGGRELYRWSADSGESWELVNCLGQPILTKNGRNTTLRFSYDAIRRLEAEWLTLEGQSEILLCRFIFGESQPNAVDHNLRTQVYRRYDQAGLVQNDDFDFKGNCVGAQTQLAEDYKGLLNWAGGDTPLPRLEPTVFPYEATYNARNQACITAAADGSRTLRTYNICGELQTLSFTHHATSQSTTFITSTAYTPDRKRQSIVYGNGSQKLNKFDAASRRLLQSKVQRNGSNSSTDTLRDVTYTYDCCGRTSNIHDAASQKTYFRNTVVEPKQDFTYDAIGRIVEAYGRERIDVSNGKSTMQPYSPSDSWAQLPGDGSEMCEYVESYEYDSVGNVLSLSHKPAKDVLVTGWKREYSYNDRNDQISLTKVGPTTESYGYNEQGCISYLRPYYTALSWDFRNRLRSSSTQVVKQGTPETTFYVYDRQGRRVRKVTERAVSEGGSTIPTKLKETIYLAGYQIYRTYKGDGQSIKHETQTSTVLEESENESTAAALVEHDPATNATIIRYQTTETLELDDKAGVVSYGEYSPFGVNTFNAVGAVIEAPRKYRFARYERDSETGLYHCGERYYAAWLGRWSSPDPIGLAGGINRYCYVNNCPTGLADRNGMMPSGRRRGLRATSPSEGEPSASYRRVEGRRGRRGQTSSDEPVRNYVSDMVNHKDTLQVFDDHPSSSVVSKDLGRRPLSVGIQGLEGCTALIIVSPTAVYFAHFFETQGFTSHPDDPKNISEAKILRKFEERVTNLLMDGEVGETAKETFQSLRGVSDKFDPANTHAFIMTPFDGPETPDDEIDESTAHYGDRVRRIKETVNALLGIPVTDIQEALYSGQGIDKADEYEKAAGRALVEYNPRAEAGSRITIHVQNEMKLQM